MQPGHRTHQANQQCMFDYPIILSAEGWVMDGMHRNCMALLLDMPTIRAVQLSINPPPDACHENASAEMLGRATSRSHTHK